MQLPEKDGCSDNQTRLTVIAKATHSCNLKCSYCYVPASAERGRMSEQTLRNLMNQAAVVGADRQISFIWHGGEPLVVGLKFYKIVASICREFRKQGLKVRNSIQTNGTLIDSSILEFIAAEKDFRFGISLDGPKYLHDFSRPYKNGTGSYTSVMESIERIRIFEKNFGKNVIGIGAICVISNHNVDKLAEIYNFFRQENIDVKFNPLFLSGRAAEVDVVSPVRFASAMCELFDLWLEDGDDSIHVDPFESVIYGLFSGAPPSCAFSRSCTETFVSVGPRGDIYPCGRFDGIKEFHLGNVNEGKGLLDALGSLKHKLLDSRLNGLDHECLDCKFMTICSGGCMHNAYIEGDVMGKDPYCEAYKMLFGHIYMRVRRELACDN